jgi:MerR family transcriptional regulator, activator of bmr gene
MKSNRLYSIGDVARIKNVTIKALRYYHKIGLFIASFIDDESGYRYYAPHQLLVLDIILIAKKTNASLESIKAMLDTFSLPVVTQFLQQQQIKLTKKQEELKDMSQTISAIRKALTLTESNLTQSGIHHRVFEERYAVMMPLDQSNYHEDVAHSQLLQGLENAGLKSTYVTGTLFEGTSLRNNLRAKAVFHLVDTIDPLTPNLHWFTIPSGTYLCVTYNTQTMAEVLLQLQDVIQTHHYNVGLLLELDLMDDLLNQEEYSSNFQVWIESSG